MTLNLLMQMAVYNMRSRGVAGKLAGQTDEGKHIPNANVRVCKKQIETECDGKKLAFEVGRLQQ